MPKDYQGDGARGSGDTGFTKYPAENAPVKKHGGNDAIHDGIVSSQEPKSVAEKSGSYK